MYFEKDRKVLGQAIDDAMYLLYRSNAARLCKRDLGSQPQLCSFIVRQFCEVAEIAVTTHSDFNFETASGSEIMARAEIFSFLLQKVSFLPLPLLTCLLLQIFFLQGKSTRKEGKKERKTLPPRPVALALVAVAHCCMSAWAGFLSLLLLVTQEGLQVELGFSQWCNESCQEWGKIFRINLHSQAANKSVVSTERDGFIPVACQQY